MNDSREPEFDLSFITELRYPEPAEVIISRFTASLRGLLKRLGQDVRTGAVGEFSGAAEELRSSLATAIDPTATHVDVFEELVLGAPEEAGTGPVLRNIIANVVADTNFSEVADNHVAIPRAKEGKFDRQRGGKLTEIL